MNEKKPVSKNHTRVEYTDPPESSLPRTTIPKNEMIACKHCGKDTPELLHLGTQHAYRCIECGAMSPMANSIDGAVANWQNVNTDNDASVGARYRENYRHAPSRRTKHAV